MNTKDEVIEFLKINDESSTKEYLTIVRQNLLEINGKYVKTIQLIIVCSLVYCLFALQVTETLNFSFVSINKPIVVDYLFPPVYMFILVRLVIIEDKLTDCHYISALLSLVTFNFSEENKKSNSLINPLLPFNFFFSINENLFNNKLAKETVLTFLPIYLLYFCPVVLAGYSFYRLALHICEHPVLIIADLIYCSWLTISLFLLTRKLVLKGSIKVSNYQQEINPVGS